jgi:hypothetical protein
METTEKKKKGRPKGSSKTKPPELIKPIESTKISAKGSQVLIDDLRAKIKGWLKEPQDYGEGLYLLSKITKKWKAYTKLIGKESENKRLKLVHELTNCLKRLESGNSENGMSSVQTKEVDSPITETEDIAAMENLSISEKIQKWIAGPRDYQRGRDLLKIVPGEELHYLSISVVETYDCKIRLGFWLKNALDYIEN